MINSTSKLCRELLLKHSSVSCSCTKQKQLVDRNHLIHNPVEKATPVGNSKECYSSYDANIMKPKWS